MVEDEKSDREDRQAHLLPLRLAADRAVSPTQHRAVSLRRLALENGAACALRDGAHGSPRGKRMSSLPVDTHTFSGPLLGAMMVIVGILAGAGRRRFTRAFWHPERSVAFALPLLMGLCLLYGTAWLLHAM